MSHELFHSSSFTINLSSYSLSEDQISVLDKGLSFIPSIKRLNRALYQNSLDKLLRRIRLFDCFHERNDTFDPRDFENRFLAPSSWCPPSSTCSQHTNTTINSILESSNLITSNNLTSHGDSLSVKFTSNLTANEFRALRWLRSNTDIVIKSADKGGSVVVMDRDLYETEALRQLNNSKYYMPIDDSLFLHNGSLINSIIDKLYDEDRISRRQHEFLSSKPPARNRYFYLLPKVHKPRTDWPHKRMPQGRPIVASCGTELANIGKFIDYYLQPLATTSSFHIKDTYHFISKVRGQRIEPHWFLVTGDVSSLYTNMDHDLIMSSIKDFFRRFPDNHRPDSALLQLMEVTLKGNDFTFNGMHFLQILGMAMGNACSPSTANLFLNKLDISATSYPIAVKFYNRFLDDLFFLWPGTLDQFSIFETFINSLIPNIHITFTISATSVNFLDITLFKHENTGDWTIETKPFFKDTDTHQLVHTKSFHPRHTFKGIIKSQFIRLKRLSSFKHDYFSAGRVLKQVLSTRGYSKRLLRRQQNDIWYNFKESNNPPTSPKQIFPMVIKYDSVGTYSARIWRDILNKNPIFNKVRIITAYSVHPNLRHILASNKLISKSDTHVPRGCVKCASIRCRACNYIVETTTFTCTVTKRNFIILQHISCVTKNLVYLITCRLCSLQYIGETGRMLRDRINDHLSAIRLNKDTPIGKHFNLPLHSISHFSIMGVESNLDGITLRRNRESFWQSVLHTLYPSGINNLPIPT